MGRLRTDMSNDEMLEAMAEQGSDGYYICISILNFARYAGDLEMGYAAIAMLDKLSVYDDRIEVLFRKICDGDFVKFRRLMLAIYSRDKGFSTITVNVAINNRIRLSHKEQKEAEARNTFFVPQRENLPNDPPWS